MNIQKIMGIPKSILYNIRIFESLYPFYFQIIQSFME